ncbi:MAG: hypothetical protein JRG80_22375 [Deltaproteobacteria bacterium]|nr:hypothetical protein [Deltaproteobacteria bacterium]MBW2401962.1 hypothetical protein [Deltaproteobacteria bacterium]MBW2666500.1 hypothetical protein [Deltaproteobacteria bacterium]
MSEGPNAPNSRFGRYLAGLAVVSMLGFVFLNYRDPWPPIVPPPLEPAPEAPAPPYANTLSLAAPPAIEPNQPAPPEDAAEVEDTVPTTSLALRLLATMVQEEPSRSLARVADAQLPNAQMMLQGQVFEGRPHVTLVAIESDSVLLANYGTLERLPLEPDGLQITADSPHSE